MEVVLIAAVAKNGVIGDDGDLPWHLPADLKRFKRTTMDHPVIMGRRTYESIVERLGEPLPGRTNIVLSRRSSGVDADVILVRDIESALDAARDTGRDVVFVIGGASIYEQFIERADRMLLTEVHEHVSGDTSFPEWDPAAWREVAREDRDGFSFVEYERRPRST